jgi:hypothetical protein
LHPLIEESITDTSYMREDRFSLFIFCNCFLNVFYSHPFQGRPAFAQMILFF